MRYRIGLILLLLTLLTFSTTAQDNTFRVYCGAQLAEADCVLLQDAHTGLFDLRSGSFEAQIRYWYENPDDPGNDDGYTCSAHGVFTDFDASGFIPSGGNPPDPRRVFASFNAAFSVEFIQRKTPANRNDPPTILTNTANLHLVDGQIYVDFASLEESLGPDYTGWGSYPLDLTPRPVATPSGPRDIIPRLVLGLDAGQLIDTFEPDLVQRHLVVTRSDDEDGQAVFETTIDIPSLYTEPIFRERLHERLNQMRERMQLRQPVLTEDEMDNVVEQMSALFPESLLLRSQMVDLDTGFLTRVTVWYIGETTPMMTAAAFGSDFSNWGLSRVEISLRIGDFNQPFEVSAPEAASPLDYATLSQMPTLGFLPVENPNQGGS